MNIPAPGLTFTRGSSHSVIYKLKHMAFFNPVGEHETSYDYLGPLLALWDVCGWVYWLMPSWL